MYSKEEVKHEPERFSFFFFFTSQRAEVEVVNSNKRKSSARVGVVCGT